MDSITQMDMREIGGNKKVMSKCRQGWEHRTGCGGGNKDKECLKKQYGNYCFMTNLNYCSYPMGYL